MSFEQYMAKNFSSLWESQGEVTVNLGWLKGFWLAAQNDKADPDTGPTGPVPPEAQHFVPKRWGWESWIVNNDRYCGKKIFFKKGKFCSYHWHKLKDEVLYIESGLCGFTWGTSGFTWGTVIEHDAGPHHKLLRPGDGFHVKPNVLHQMYALEDTVILEFSTKHLDEDSYRFTEDLINPEYWSNVRN